MNHVLSIKYYAIAMVIALLFWMPISVSAHVSVKPAEVGVGQRLNFIVSVPTEEDNPTTEVRLVMPAGLQSVRPNAKSGWNVQINRVGESMKGEVLNTGQPAPNAETVTEIVWSGGSIPIDMRDEFMFSAQAPEEEGEINWKAYQTYSDGTVATWDSDAKTVEEYAKSNPVPDGGHDDNAPKPYSVTRVINDLAASPKAESRQMIAGDNISGDNLPLILSVLAVIVSGFSLGIALRKR